MKNFRKFWRLIQINYVLAKYGLDEIIFAMHWFAPLSFLSYFNPWYWLRNRYLPRSLRLRLALEELGPIFVKFGQMLSTRPDLLPDDIISELAKLQDKVAPFAGSSIIIEKTLGHPLTQLFLTFDSTVLASASIAQVHAATLLNGEKVVVKVKRPRIEKIIKRDISILFSIAKLAEKYTLAGRRLRASDLVSEFSHSLLDELDLMREASNAAILKRNFEHSTQLHVPAIYWDYCRQNILVMERIYGIPVGDIEMLKQHHINLSKLTQNIVEVFFTQVFRDCFFHADMHPGNIFVDPKNPDDPQYIAVDFGIMGSLSTTDQRYLAENLLAFFKRDYRRVAELHLESGWIPADTRLLEFESAISTVCEPIFQKPLKEISFSLLLMRLFQTGKRFHMEIQPQLLLLQKTLLHIESLGRMLCPELDIWSKAEPILEEWMRRELGPSAFFRKIRTNLPIWAERLPEVPNLIYQYLQKHQEPGVEPVILPVKQKPTFFWLGASCSLLIAAGILYLAPNIEQFHLSTGKLSILFAFIGLAGLLLSFMSSRRE